MLLWLCMLLYGQVKVWRRTPMLWWGFWFAGQSVLAQPSGGRVGTGCWLQWRKRLRSLKIYPGTAPLLCLKAAGHCESSSSYEIHFLLPHLINIYCICSFTIIWLLEIELIYSWEDLLGSPSAYICCNSSNMPLSFISWLIYPLHSKLHTAKTYPCYNSIQLSFILNVLTLWVLYFK